jgi:hypothetical protein
MQIQIQSIFRIRAVLLAAGLFALALGLHVQLNPVARAHAASAPIQTAQLAQTLDDRFAAVARLVPSFGGFFIGDDGRLNVYLTDRSQLAVAMQAIVAVFGRTRLPLENPVALQGRYGFLQLKAWHDLHRRQTLAMPGVSSVDIDEMQNLLEIGVTDFNAMQNVRQSLERLGIPSESFNISEVAPMKIQQTLQSKWRPIAGGIQIARSGLSGVCTLGVLAVLQNKAGFITASHCTTAFGAVDSTVITQANNSNSNRIGVELFDPPLWTGSPCPSGRLCRQSDAAFIWRDGAAVQPNPLVAGDFGYLLVADKPDSGVPAKYLITSREDFSVAGEYVDKVGRTTGRSHGQITNTCADTNQTNPDGTDTGRTMICQNFVSALSDGGDSGSPVFSLEQIPGGSVGARLHGVLWGGNGPQPNPQQERFVFSHLFHVDHDLQNVGAGSLKVYYGDKPSSTPMVKIRKPSNNDTVALGGINGVDFVADVVDYEDQDLKLTWTSDLDGVIGFGKTCSYIFTTPGSRKITVTATDDEGLTSKDEITITVEQNTPPKMTIKFPFPNGQLFKGVTYSFEGDSYDPDEVSDKLACSQLYWTSKPGGISFPVSLGTGCNVPATFTSLGQYTITLFGTDSQGAKGTAQVTIQVVEPPASGKPIVTIVKPADNELLLAGTKYTFLGSATDPNYTTPMNYTWELEMNGTTYILGSGWATNGQQISLNWTPTSQQLGHTCKSYLASLKLRVIDPDGEMGVQVKLIYIDFGPC